MMNIVLVGLGQMGKLHAQLVIDSPISKLAAVVAPNNANNNTYSNQLGIQRFDTIAECLSNIACDGATIASPNLFHAAHALSFIKRDIPLLIEKPMATSVTEAEIICDEACARGVSVLIGHHRTHSNYTQAAKHIIASGVIGDLVAIQASALLRKPMTYFTPSSWRTESGGGPILINLIHDIGLITYLGGKITQVASITSYDRRKLTVEDSASIAFQCANRAIGTLLLSDAAASDRSWELTSGENPLYPHSIETACYHFAGTRGSLDLPTMLLRTFAIDSEPSWISRAKRQEVPVVPKDPLASQLSHFERIIMGTDVPLVSAEDGLEYLRVVEAVHKASALGGIQKL
mgnify:CR=1 FL=1